MKKSAKDLVAEAKARIENLGVEEVAAELEQSEPPLLIDLREPEELAEHGRVPGALHIPRGMLEFRADPTLPYHNEALDPKKRTILHCASGGRSALACAQLQEMGYENVAHMDGGFTAWKEADRPVQKGS